MTSIRMPRLMDRHLQEQERLQPLTLSLTLTTEGLSTARMTLGADAPRVAVQDFIELYSQHLPGRIGIGGAGRNARGAFGARPVYPAGRHGTRAELHEAGAPGP